MPEINNSTAKKAISASAVTIYRSKYSARAVYAAWTFDDGNKEGKNKDTEQFEYIWQYYVPASGMKSVRKFADTQTVRKDNVGAYDDGLWHDSGSTGTVSALAYTEIKHSNGKVYYTYTTEDYTPPEYATRVRFKVKPIAKETSSKNGNNNAKYTSNYCGWVPSEKGYRFTLVDLPIYEVPYIDVDFITDTSSPLAGSFVATCLVGDDNLRKYREYLSGYEVKWQCFIENTWNEASTVTVDISLVRDKFDDIGKNNKWGFTNVFSDFPAGTTMVQAVITPVSLVEGVFTPAPNNGQYHKIAHKWRAIKKLEVQLAPATDRGVQAFWSITNTNLLTSFSYEWEYYVATINKTGAWTPGEDGEVEVSHRATDTPTWMASYTIPETANKVRIRVKPVSSSASAAIIFNDIWSEWEEFEYDIPTRETLEPTLEIMEASERTILAIWSLPRIPTVFEKGKTYLLGEYCKKSENSNKIYKCVEVPDEPDKTFNSDHWEEVDITKEGVTFWSKTDFNNLDSFEYEWRYKVVGSTYWFPGSTSTVKAGSPTQAATSATTRWSVSYDPPANAKFVQFRVRPIAKYSNAFSGAWSTYVQYNFEVNKTKVLTPEITIDVYSAPDRSLYANWNFAEAPVFSEKKTYAVGDYCLHGDYLYQCTTAVTKAGKFKNKNWTKKDVSSYSNSQTDSFEYEWEYHVHNLWFPGESGTTSYARRVCTYSLPAEASRARVRVRPIPIYERYYEGEWSNYKRYDLVIPSKKIDDGSLNVRLYSGTDRTILVSWTMADLSDVGSFSLEWRYKRLQVEADGRDTEVTLDGGSGSTTPYARYFTFDAPEDASEVEVRVMPVAVAENLFNGQWTKYADGKYAFRIEPRTIENLTVGLQKGSERTIYATWSIDGDNRDVASYSYEWQYFIDPLWYDGSTGTANTENPVCTYDAPALSGTVRVRVRPEPLHTSDFAPTWSNYITFLVPKNTDPEVPDVPEVTITGFNLKAQLDNYDDNAVGIEFEIVDDVALWTSAIAPIELNRAAATVTVVSGKTYRARARALNAEGLASDWSNYSSDVSSFPAPLPADPTCMALSTTSVEVNWNDVTSADSYEVEYATKKRYFDAAPSQVQSVTIEIGTRAEITGLETGQEYFFRVRTKNSQGESEWSNVVSAVIGTVPGPPTTWSSTTTGTVDRDIFLYWVHNSEDNSLEKEAEVELIVNGIPETHVITNESEDPEHTSEYLLPANTFNAGAIIQWRVRTKGVMDDYGDWSTQRFVNVYTPPILNMILSDGTTWNQDGFEYNTENIYEYDYSPALLNDSQLRSFPLLVYFDTYPKSQKPVSYSITITSNETYDGFTDTGSSVPVRTGQTLYQRVISTDLDKFMTIINAGDVNLESGISYTLSASVSLDSGLSAEATYRFIVQWGDEDFYLDAEIAIDSTTLAAYISPYCMNSSFQIRNDVTLGVYRRDFDGGFTEIAKDLINTDRITVTDPHPSLDFARYRITATSISTGRVYFLDLHGVEIGETSIIIQWDEKWSNFDATRDGGRLVEQPWTGSMVKLPYNVDISESNTIDVELVEYIGRSHPVGYYGTQIGQEGNWNSEIPATDKDTVYALRRLAKWMGNAYVREPSGSGYWAQVAVSFNRNHNETVIPVSINVKRVEGGM